MTIEELLSLITQVSLILVAMLTLVDFLRQRDRTRLDIMLMFGTLALIILLQGARNLSREEIAWINSLGALLLLAQPYLLLRLVRHFREVPRAVEWSALGGMTASWAMLLLFAPPLPGAAALTLVAYFVGVESYAAAAFVLGAVTRRGVTRWRLALAAAGSGLLAATILLAGLQIVLPVGASFSTLLSRLLAALAGLSYYLGFAPPRWLRRTWQMPELYRFLRKISGRGADQQAAAILEQLCDAATQLVGGMGALAALPEDAGEQWRVEASHGLSAPPEGLALLDGAASRAWRDSRPVLGRSPAEFGLNGKPQVIPNGARALLAVSIRTQERTFGLLLAFLRRAPLFVSDDLDMLALLAEQAALVLAYATLLGEQHGLIEHLQGEIAERQRMEQELRKWAHLFEHAEWGVVMGSADGKTLELMNPAFARMHGLTVEELRGKPILDVFAPETRAGLAEHMRTAHETGHHTFESRHIRKDGTAFPVVVDVTAVKDAAGKLLYRAVNVQDITERKRVEERIQQLNEALEHRAAELEAANQELEAFSYSVSHDLRAPLRAVDGFSRILLEKHAPQLDPEAQRYLGLVRDNARQMGQLIDDLLTFARLSRQAVNRQQVAPAELVQQVLENLRDEHSGRQIEISFGDLPLCAADPALLRQVFANLLANALKFTREREGARIEVGCQPQDGQRIYFVRDNGVGFDMRYAHKLFGVFQRLHRPEEYEGTGVGLAIVQRIVHRHGGRVWAESEPGSGATFYFTLGGAGDGQSGGDPAG